MEEQRKYAILFAATGYKFISSPVVRPLSRAGPAYLSQGNDRFLLQRYQHLNDTGALGQRFQRFSHDCAEHLAAVRSLHSVARSG